MTTFFVVMGENKVAVNGFVDALDVCLKIFILYKIEYPPESKAVWILLNKIFFNLEAGPLMTGRVCALFNDLFNIQQ